MKLFSFLPFSSLWLLFFFTRSAAETRQYKWRVTQSLATLDGVTRLVYGINDRPGHDSSIVVALGDAVEVWVHNAINEPTCIHWHGMRQFGTQASDGASGVTQCSIQPGRSMLYKFTATAAGSFWWHSHDGTQYVDGLRGPLIVLNRPELYHPGEYGVDREFTVELTDWYHEQSAVLLQQMMNPVLNPDGNEPVWDNVLINNRGRFDCSKVSTLPCTTDQPLTRFVFEAGKRYRLRLVSVAAFAAFDFSIDNHEFRVIAADGVNVQPSGFINSIRINVGQRYDIIVEAKKQSPVQQADSTKDCLFWMRATSLYGDPWTSLPLDQFPPGFNPNGLAIVQYAKTDAEPTTTPWAVIKTIPELGFTPLVASQLPVHPHKSVTVEFTMKSTPENPVVLGYMSINGGPERSFEMPDKPTLFEVARGKPLSALPPSSNIAAIPSGRKQIEIRLINKDAGEHPFHLHGHAPWVLGAGTMLSAQSEPTGLNLYNPMQRDVYTVPGCTVNVVTGNCDDVGYVVLRLESDNPGVWMLHCHIDWHLATGLAMVFVEGAKELKHVGMAPFKSIEKQTCSGLY